MVKRSKDVHALRHGKNILVGCSKEVYGSENSTVHQSHSQNDSGDLRGVTGGDGKLGCLCGKAGTSRVCDGSTHSSGCVVNGYGCLLNYYLYLDWGASTQKRTLDIGSKNHVIERTAYTYIRAYVTGLDTRGKCAPHPP